MKCIKTTLSAMCLLLLPVLRVCAQPSLPQVVSGRIERVDTFHSKFVTARTVDVWLPNGYNPNEKYAVLYMHDGQMLFDPEQSWNKQAWNVDDVAARLMAGNLTRKFIVVGVWNGGSTRHSDYFPQKPFEQLKPVEKDSLNARLQRLTGVPGDFQPQSDNYLRFLVQELKPYIDTTYAVYTNRANTFIAGSSMGGLISMYAICEYPQVFGGAACMSTHWPGTFSLEDNPVPDAFLQYLRQYSPNPGSNRFYFDCGDQELDALYPAIQQKADSIVAAKGYDSTNWLTRYFPGEAHTEIAWSKRLEIPLLFLLKQ